MLGDKDGAVLGIVDGRTVGSDDGSILGWFDGNMLGDNVGAILGFVEVGFNEGATLG